MKQRSLTLDVIRSIAFFNVILIHFFLNSGFNSEIVSGAYMYLMSVMRTAFLVCVPMFIMLSGYLMKNKKASLTYYLKISKVILTYVLSSLCCELYRIIFLKKEISVSGFIKGVASFYTAPYSWYIQMYIVLYAIIPFLNYVYNFFQSKKFRLFIIFSLFVITVLPSIFNINRIIVPEFIVKAYIILYYFIGSYFNDYPPDVKKYNMVIFAIVTVIAGSFNFYMSYGTTFKHLAIWQHWGAISTVIQSVLMFTTLLSHDYSKLSENHKKIITKISDYSLAAYLLSWIFDHIFYGILKKYVPVMIYRIYFFIPVVIVVTICSVLLSAIVTETVNKILSIHKLIKID